LAHQYGPGEDDILSDPVRVDLAAFLQPMYRIRSVVEKTLSVTQNWTDFVRHKKYNWTTPVNGHGRGILSTATTTAAQTNTTTTVRRRMATRNYHKNKRSSCTEKNTKNGKDRHNDNDDAEAMVTLFPLDIRTFEVTVEPSG
jgi:hypothetical protein